MNSFVETLLIMLGALIVFGGVIGVIIYLHSRAYSRIYDEMKAKLTPLQFDVWLKIQSIQNEINRIERGITSSDSFNSFAGHRYMFAKQELHELKDQEAELWEKFYWLGR